MADGPGEAHQVARFVSVHVPGNKRTSRNADYINGSQRLEIFLRKYPYLRGLAHRLAHNGESRPLVILDRVTAFHERAGPFWPYLKTKGPGQIGIVEKSN
jgi:hypothetical protein